MLQDLGVKLRQNLSTLEAFMTKVIYCWVLITKLLKDREFQFVYICSLLSTTQFIMKQNGSKLQVLAK